MALISEKHHKDKLKKHGINIKTKYIVGNKILERNTDDSINDDILKGVRSEKQYFLNNKLVHTEKIFDTRIEYSYIINNKIEEEHTCVNCGMTSKLKEFIDGCPYCKTHYNIDYTNKDLGSKYYYDRVLKSNTYRIITGIVDLIISLILSFFFIKYTSRTFNNVDIIKIFVYGGILSLVLYYIFYSLDAYLVLGPIKRYKDKQNQKQIDFWNKTKYDKKTFFNNLNYEIRKLYYGKENIIDYDILDYLEFNEKNNQEKKIVEVIAEVRIITLENNKIKSEIVKDSYSMLKHDKGTLELKDGANLIKCPSCGSSIDANKGKCSYCHSEINYLQEWILINKNNEKIM